MRVILVGGGKTSYFLAKRFLSKNHHVTIVTPSAAEARGYARDLRVRVLLGDGTSPVLLNEAEATRAEALLALLPRDEEVLVPAGDTVLHGGDRLVLVSQPKDYGRFLRVLLGAEA